MVIFAIVVFVLAAVNWYFVFNNKARQKHSSLIYYFHRLNSGERNMYDGLGLAVHVCAATVFSVLLFLIIVLGVTQLFR